MIKASSGYGHRIRPIESGNADGIKVYQCTARKEKEGKSPGDSFCTRNTTSLCTIDVSRESTRTINFVLDCPLPLAPCYISLTLKIHFFAPFLPHAFFQHLPSAHHCPDLSSFQPRSTPCPCFFFSHSNTTLPSAFVLPRTVFFPALQPIVDPPEVF